MYFPYKYNPNGYDFAGKNRETHQAKVADSWVCVPPCKQYRSTVEKYFLLYLCHLNKFMYFCRKTTSQKNKPKNGKFCKIYK